MKSFLFLALLALTSVVCAHEGHDHVHTEGDGHEHVLTLTKDNFQTTIDGNDMVLVEFYAPWCGHCKRLAPEYEKAATQLYGKIPLAKVDCTTDKDVCNTYGVQGFPTIKLFRKGSQPSDYEKGRTASEIVKYLQKQNQPVVATLTTEDAVATLKASDDIVVIGYLSDNDEAVKAINEAAQELRDDAVFGVAPPSLGGANSNRIVVYRKFSPTEDSIFTETFTKANLVSFVKAESFPVFGEIGPENYQKYVDRGLPLGWFFLDLEAEGTAAIKEAAAAVAASAKDKFSAVWLDGKRWASHAKNFGLSGNTPGIVIEVRDGNKFVFPETNTVNKDTLSTFFNSWLDGSLAATVRSQEIPATQEGPVTVVVGKSYDTIVNDATKDVLLEFYAPWCGHCKTLAPRYDELAEQMKQYPNVVIAKIDATENDTPRDDVKGFPTIIFFPANDKKGAVYKGERTTEALANYVKENGSTFKAGGAAKHDEL